MTDIFSMTFTFPFTLKINHFYPSYNSIENTLSTFLIYMFLMSIIFWGITVLYYHIYSTCYYLKKIYNYKYIANNKNIYLGRIFLFFVYIGIYNDYITISYFTNTCLMLYILENIGIKFIE